MKDGSEILRAIRAGAEAGKLRAYVRKNGGDRGLAGLLRLADRHSEVARAALRAAPAR